LGKFETSGDGLQEMEEILKNAEVGRVAFCDDSVPYVVPLNFLYYDARIAFHCAWKGKKLDIIRKNPNCCFEVDEFMGEVSYHYDERCHLDYDSVLAFGKAHVENDETEKTRLLQLFAEKYSEIYRRPLSEGGKRFGKSRVSECCCVVINVEELTGRRERTREGKRKKIMWQHRF
jgi:nitroimidazol reductase NimA-like FMN-containing flavoprotein (pyridoxamine 5'-phosphate oxidase superfamily)